MDLDVGVEPGDVRERATAVLAALAVWTVVLILVPSLLSGYLVGTALALVAVVVLGAASWTGDRRIAAAGVVAWFVAGALFWAPWWQGIVYEMVVRNPGGLQWLFVGGVVALASVAFERYREEAGAVGSMGAVAGATIAVVGFFVVGPYVGGVYAQEHVAGEIEANVDTVEELPESNVSVPRIVPQSVAKNWATNSLQYPRYKLAGGDITYLNGTPHWSYALSPDGIKNTLTLKQTGAVYVNMSSIRKDIAIRDDDAFRYGVGMALTDGYEWHLARRDYWNQYHEPFVVPGRGGGSNIVVPYSEHDWEFRATPLPQFYSVPKFGGVKVIAEDGTTRDMSPAEAQRSDLLGERQNYYPYSLARYRVESMKYKNGIVNTLPVVGSHYEQIEVAPVPGQGNSQPFTVPTEDGIKYFLAVEPWGEANGIYQVWTVDAQTGEMSVMKLDQKSALRGPRKAVDAITSVPTINRLTDAEAVEPVPVVKNGTLYWQVRIVPGSAARIQYVAFFDARTESVAIVETTGDVRAFLSERRRPDFVGGNTGNDGGGGDGGGADGRNCEFYVTIDEDGDGDTDRRVCVPPGGSVSVEPGGAVNRTNSTTAPG